MIPFGKAKTVRPGTDATIVTYGATVFRSAVAAARLSEEDGREVEVLDLRSLAPYDFTAVAESVKRTNRLLVVHEDWQTHGFGAEIAARAADELFPWLDAPVRRVAAKDAFCGYAPQLENATLPQSEDFLAALAVDPLPVYRAVQEKRLFLSGARREVFAADDGTSLSAFVLGPLSAERPVVLLHGLGADATYWTGAARFLARHGRTVILPDAPGSGHSEPPRDPAGFGLRGRVAAMDALARALALEKFDFVGHSLGGWTAGWYALEFPWKVSRLVLVDAACLTLPKDAEAERARVLPDRK